MKKRHINNEGGFVLITSLLMLVILTIIGISATNTTTTELQIAGNDKFAKQDFYEKEATCTFGLLDYKIWEEEILKTLDGHDLSKTVGYPTNTTPAANCEYRDSSGNVIGTYKVRTIGQNDTDVLYWEDGIENPANKVPESDAISAYDNKTRVGSGNGIDRPNVHCVITGYSKLNDSTSIIQIGTVFFGMKDI